MGFAQWIDRLVDEKEFDRYHLFEKEGPSGLNVIPLQVVIDAIKSAPETEQDAIKDVVVRLDFRNADILKYFDHLAAALAV